MSEAIFPAAEDDGCGAFRAIAHRVGCDEYAVSDAFRGLRGPEWEVPQHLDAVKRTAHAMNEAARHAKNLHAALGRLSEDQRRSLTLAGAVTMPQIEHLLAVLAGDASGLQDWLRNRNRRGGRNPAAYIVSEGMRRLYRRLRKRITFGQDTGGGPSTDFGRDVEFALGAFGVSADWRGPAREAFAKQLRREERLARCAHARALKEAQESPLPPLDISGISISFEGQGRDQTVLVSVDDRPHVPPLRLKSRWFSSGHEIVETAREWAESLGAGHNTN